MFPSDIFQWHAALNDLPALLLVLSVVLDVAGSVTQRESLKAAGFWTLVIGAAGAVPALVTGLLAEEVVEHGGRVHEIIERHELMGKILTGYFIALAGWRVWRKGTLSAAERPTYLTLAGVGALFMLWMAHLGGTIVYEHGAGIRTEVLQRALDDRTAGHEHAPGEEHDPEPAAANDAAADTGHAHPPGTPAHQHE